MFFVTYHGTFLCLDAEGRLTQRPARDIADLSELLDLDIATEGEAGRFRRAMEGETGQQAVVVPSGPLAGQVVHLLGDRRTAAISNSGLFYCAPPGNALLDPCRPEIQGWETFACLTRQDAADLLHILGHDWVVGSTAAIIPQAEITVGDGFCLRIGSLALDLRYNLPILEPTRSPDSNGATLLSAIVLVDGWRVDHIHLFRPMIFLTAFRSSQYIEQAAMCITSLLEFGAYRGDFHIISDRPREEFLAALPALDPSRLSVQTIEAADWVGYVASKYCVLDAPEAQDRQPLLFLDPDIMADADLSPMLAAIAISPRIMAPMEDFHPLHNSVSVGASLIKRAGGKPRFERGFNGGTIGIPNLRVHGVFLRTIRTIIANHLELHGRDAFRWVDQEVANYVSFAAGHFDATTMLRYVRFGWEGTEHTASQRIGLIHFWPPRGPVSKNEAMRIYTETLRAADAIAH